MNDIDARRIVGDALGELVDGLQPFVSARFEQVAPGLSDWTELLARKDRQAGKRFDRYHQRDLSLLLRALTESFGTLGYPFHGILNRQASNCASELRNVRNKWAHQEDFTVAETYRALDSAEILLNAAFAQGPAQQVAALKSLVLRAMSPPPKRPGAADTAQTTVAAAATADAAPVLAADAGQAQLGADIAGPREATIRLQTLPVLSYALARNQIPIVDEVTVEYRGAELRGASVEIEAICELGSLGDPKVVIVDLDGIGPTTLRNADLALDPARALAVENPMPATIRVTLRDSAGREVARTEASVEVLAANQWKSEPPQLSLELLTAFVQPNSSAIAPLLLDASDRLRAATGNPALDGYQQGSPERVDAIVEAIYESMRARDIRYAEPPASWGLVGQKIRTPAEVLEGRLGTCLDMTVTLAAALEEVGINTTLWLLEGHSLLGYWRQNASLDGPAQSDAAEVMNYVGLGQLELVETTLINGGVSEPFAAARRHPHTHQLRSGDVSRVIGVADVMQARLARIYPLPSRSVTESGEVVVREYAVAAAPEALSHRPSAESLAGEVARDAPPRVAQWKNSLLDLSLRNRLIHYGEKSGYVLAVPQPSLAQFEDMINSGDVITLVPADHIPTVERGRGIRSGQDLPEASRAAMLTERKSAFISVSEATYTPRLRALAHKAKTIIEETGANNLYLAFGMLRWTFNDRELRSPLVLVPVTLESSARGQVFRLVMDETGESTPNYCLLEKLRVSFGLEIPGLAVPVKDDAGIDLPAAFAATRQALAQARLPFTVEDTVDLSILQFAKYRLWKDLDENWRDLSRNALVSHLIGTPTEQFADPAMSPEATDLDALGNAVPVAADSSQLEAVADAVAGRTFVLEGPPGTGKSQTITNLLARALANGKKVLFVAEKRAALDVVKDRLDAVGLGPFALDLHDKAARPAAVRAQIRAAIDARSRPDGAALNANIEAATTSRGSLRRYAERLHEPNAAGLSMYSARAQLLASPDDVEALAIPLSLVASAAPEQVQMLRDSLRRLPETADLAHPAPLHAWGFVDPSGSAAIDSVSIHTAARRFDDALTRVLEHGADRTLLSLADGPAMLREWAALAGAPRQPISAIDALRDGGGIHTAERLRGDLDAVSADPAWFATVGPEALLGDVRAVHAAAVAADASSVFGRRKRRRAALGLYGMALRAPVTQVPARAITPLAADVLQTADRLAALRAGLASLPIVVAPQQWVPWLAGGAAPVRSALDWLIWLARNLPAADTGPSGSALREYYRASTADRPLASALAAFADAWTALESAVAASGADAGPNTLSTWAAPSDVASAWVATRDARNLEIGQPVTLDRWFAFTRALAPIGSAGLSDAHHALLTGRIPADLASIAFDKGIAVASIAERADSQAMSAFDVAAHNRTVERFTMSGRRIREELPRWIPAEIIGNRRIDPSYEGGMMGELKRQLTRQRGGMSVRALFENYGELIVQIAPCVLMSPESVARFFPPRAGMFDIVVFDEASQIRVADAAGAMGRAASVVVVGDSKQMPPTSFAEVSVDVDADAGAADVVADEESILTECVQARVARRWLSWHYRSQDESLITFSNHAYYDSRLSSFPAPWRRVDDLADSDHGVSLVRVAGHFNRSGSGRELRTNAVEASAIVDEVSRHFAASPDVTPSIGIVTFNAPQRTLIETMLRDAADERIARALDERDGLFVKNLENVQGDERDTILFSVAFSANDRGYIPLNFGPLSRAGGERRLNVAITRARRQVILFCSFDPSDLRAEETASVGIKHLKGYLELASSGVDSKTDGAQREQIIDRHRDEIANELRYLGFAVKTDIGLSEFRIDLSIADGADPDQPLVAVLLDGEGWRERRTVADRDGLPVDVLERLMNWPAVERVWLPEWLQEREATLTRLSASVTAAASVLRARNAGGGAAAQPPVADGPSADREPIVAAPGTLVRAAAVSSPDAAPAVRHAQVRQFVPWEPKTVGPTTTLDRLPSPASVERVRSVLRQIIEREGPIHTVRLVKLTAESFGLTRVAQARLQAILRCLPPEYRRVGDPSCVWPIGVDPTTWREVRRSQPGDGRILDHVPLEEIANAMAVVTELAGGMTEAEVKREALGMFGGRRLTGGISSRLDSGLQCGLTSGRLQRDRRGLIAAVLLK